MQELLICRGPPSHHHYYHLSHHQWARTGKNGKMQTYGTSLANVSKLTTISRGIIKQNLFMQNKLSILQNTYSTEPSEGNTFSKDTKAPWQDQKYDFVMIAHIKLHVE